MIYDYQCISVPNYAAYGLFAENPFVASRWDKLIIGGLEIHVDIEYFDPSNQHHGHCMPDLHVNWLTLDEGR